MCLYRHMKGYNTFTRPVRFFIYLVYFIILTFYPFIKGVHRGWFKTTRKKITNTFIVILTVFIYLLMIHTF